MTMLFQLLNLGHDGVVNLEEGEVFPGENTGHLDNLDSFSETEQCDQNANLCFLHGKQSDV